MLVEAGGREPSLGGASKEPHASAARDDREFEWYVRWIRHSCTPGSAVAEIERYRETDLRDVLSSIRVPTLILFRRDTVGRPLETARYLASRIQGAKLVELPGVDLAHWYGDSDGFADEIEEFITGVRHAPESDRVLATLLFTDIVGSTERAADLGDRRWAELLDAHHDAVRRELDRYRGREIETAGDGFLATFDGPARAVRCAMRSLQVWEALASMSGLGVIPVRWRWSAVLSEGSRSTLRRVSWP